MNERTSIIGRMFLLFGLILLIPVGIALQILRVNMLEGDGLRELWSSQAFDFIPIPAQRGNIYDENGSLLATNRVIYKVAVDPRAPGTTNEHLRNISNVLNDHTGRGAAYYNNRIRNAPNHSRYIVLERSINVQAYEDLRQLGYRSIILEEEYRRNYSFESLSAHTLGFVNHNLDGMAGLESKYNEILKGEDGVQQVRKDRSNRIFAYVGAPRKLPVQGNSIYTTINAQAQAILEEELEEGVKRHRASYGTAIVMNPKTGAIRAMANYPTYNPNSPGSADNENRRNYAVADMVEPGSTFKLVAALAAIEQGVTDFDEKFETPSSGRKMIHGQAMRDHDPLGTLAFDEVFAKSSNIATSEIAMRLKPETYYQYARNMGFGTNTNIDLPNEQPGRLQKPYEWSRVTLPWMSIGYEVQVTPIQLVQAYAAFANGGVLMKPYVVNEIRDEFGNIKKKTRPESVRRIAKKSTIDKLMPVFEKAVSDSGTAGWASVEGLRIAGKTGTAQKYIDGRYQARYRASFVGFFPVEDPEYVILVMLDEPRTSIYGGFTAGSIFKEIATRISGLDNNIYRGTAPDPIAETDEFVAPNIQGLTYDHAKLLLAGKQVPVTVSGEGSHVISQAPEPGEKFSLSTPIQITRGHVVPDSLPDGYAQIPDLNGLNMRQATNLLLSRGLNIETIGSGTIYTQFPRAGDLFQKGRTVTVRGKARSMQSSQSMVSN